MNRSGAKDRRNEAVISPEDYGYEETQMGHRNFKNKTRAPIKSYGDISHKRGAVSFNLGRIVPKNITHDKEYLYEQNIKLKQSVKQFQNELLKLKTRLTATQNQKQKLVDEFSHSDMPLKRESSRAVRRNNNPYSSSIQNQNYMKRMLRQTKDQTTKLKTQNMRLKRTVKYTQINELNIQNGHLYDQLSRLTNIIQSKVLDQNDNNQQLCKKIAELKDQLQHEKDNSRMISGQMKKKNQQIQQLKSKLLELSTKEKKSRKDLDDYRKALKNQKVSKASSKSIKNNQYFNQARQCQKCQQYKKQLKYYKQLQLKSIKDNNNKSINSQSENKNSQAFVNVHTQVSKSTPNKNENKKVEKVQKEQNTLKASKNGKDKEKTINEKQKQNKQQQIQNQYDDNFDNDEYEKDNFQESEKNPNERKQDGKEANQYQQQFENIQKQQGSQKQQVIFKKQDKGTSRQNKQILKETITYRMMCQKYSYQDLTSDIKQSKMKEFSVQQIATMLNDQPFFLNQEQLEIVLSHIFGQANLDLQDKVKAKDFLKKVKDFIGDFKQLQDQKQDKLIQKSFAVLKKEYKGFTKQLNQQSGKNGKNGKKTVTKDQFVKILKQYKLSPQQIQVIISQVAMISVDIDSINYQQFLNKLNE